MVITGVKIGDIVERAELQTCDRLSWRILPGASQKTCL